MKITLGQEERYDATLGNCVSFKKANDIINGKRLPLSNMCGGFPFEFNGDIWKCSEMLYLCGEFSENTEKHNAIQKELISVPSGYASKRFIKAKYLSDVRMDFFEFRLQWMLFVVWQKCKGNKDFADLLKSIPSDIILIENTTTDNGGSANIWGCANHELEDYRKSLQRNIEENMSFKTKKAKEEYINIEINKRNDIGTFVGQNNIGKILMLCRDALKNNSQPQIDYELLSKHDIYIFGKKLSFKRANEMNKI